MSSPRWRRWWRTWAAAGESGGRRAGSPVLTQRSPVFTQLRCVDVPMWRTAVELCRGAVQLCRVDAVELCRMGAPVTHRRASRYCVSWALTRHRGRAQAVVRAHTTQGALPSPPFSSRVLFGRLSMKPGKPTTAAVLELPPAAPGGRPTHCLVLALPGNPVSAFVGFHVLAAPAVSFCILGGARRLQALVMPSQALCHSRIPPPRWWDPTPHTSAPTPSLAPAFRTQVRCLAGLPWASALPPRAGVTMLDALACDPERPEFHRATLFCAPPRPGAPLQVGVL